MVTDRDKYFFDLNGYIILRGACNGQEIKDLNDTLDAIPKLDIGEWWGGVHCHTYGTKDGYSYQQIYEAGPAFEKLIDHPSWIEHLKTFIGGQMSFDAKHGPLFIDENFVNFRDPGEAIGMHSGAHAVTKRNSYRVMNQNFMAMQVNVLMALRDIGPGDGGTMILPGSHKEHFMHPDMAKVVMKQGGASGDGLEGAIEVHLKAGDALIFTDTLMHGSAKRMNPGQRRIVVQRYGPSWGMFRHPYRPTRELLKRLTPERRKLVWPHDPVIRNPQRKPGFEEITPSYSDIGTWDGRGG